MPTRTVNHMWPEGWQCDCTLLKRSWSSSRWFHKDWYRYRETVLRYIAYHRNNTKRKTAKCFASTSLSHCRSPPKKLELKTKLSWRWAWQKSVVLQRYLKYSVSLQAINLSLTAFTKTDRSSSAVDNHEQLNSSVRDLVRRIELSIEIPSNT